MIWPGSRNAWIKYILYPLIFIISFLIIIINPTTALSARKTKYILSTSRYIPAKAAIVIDPNRSVIYAKNPGAKLPPASTTKLITAMVVLDHLAPERNVRISPNAAMIRSIRPRLRAYEELTVENLLYLALMKSLNSAAVALAEETAGSEDGFVELMNQKAVEIGANNTRFANASGLPEGMQYTTVYDLTMILNEAIKYPLIKEILGKKECSIVTPEGRSLLLRNTNKMLWKTDNMIGGKTGYTGKAQHCFVGALQTEEGPVFTAILGTTSRNRLWKSTEKLLSLKGATQVALPMKLADNSKDANLRRDNKTGRHLSRQRYNKHAARLVRRNKPASTNPG